MTEPNFGDVSNQDNILRKMTSNYLNGKKAQNINLSLQDHTKFIGNPRGNLECGKAS